MDANNPPKNVQSTQTGNNKPGGSTRESANPRGVGKLRGQERDSSEVRVSKTLSWLLRHGAKGEGLPLRPDGYVNVTDLVCTFFR